ncbi:MAG: putative Ig domain-containing protein [Candidatus Wallbacteria bacterium]|nr:putative Ig domain-containing protein [Candidatus Wallbacteria bacterium]
MLGLLVATPASADGTLAFQSGVSVDISGTATINLVFTSTGSGAQTSGPIAVITVRGLSAGTAGLVLSRIDASDDIGTVPVTAGAGSVTVNAAPPPPPTWVTTAGALTAGTQSSAYSLQLSATGSPTPTYAVLSGTLPAGITLSTAGLLSGTPTGSGDFSFTVRATNTGGNSDRAFTLHLAGNGNTAPSFTTAAGALTAGQVGAAYSATIAASGTPNPTFSVTTGLPPGLTLASSGAITGSPTAQGTFTFTVTATNIVSTATRQFSILIAAAPAVLTARITATGGAPGAILLDGTASTGGPTSFTWSLVSGPSGAAPLFGNSIDFSGRANLFVPGTTTAKTSFLARAAGTYTFQLDITGGSSSTTNTQAIATIANVPPKAIALPGDVIVRRNALAATTFTLDGRRSFDANRLDTGVTYSWSNDGGYTISPSTGATATISIPAGNSTTFGTVSLTVTGDGTTSNTDTDSFTVLAAASIPPQANAGFSRTIVTTASTVSVQLFGRDSATPGAGAATFAWTQIDTSAPSVGTITATTDPSITLTSATEPGILYAFRLRLTQGGVSDTDDVAVRVVKVSAGVAPTARFTITRADAVAVNTAIPTPVAPIAADITVVNATSIPVVRLDASTSSNANVYTWALVSDAGLASSGSAPNTPGATLSAQTGAQVDLLISRTGTFNFLLTTRNTTSGKTATRRGRVTMRSSTTPLAFSSTTATYGGQTITLLTKPLPAATSATTVTLTAATSGGTAPVSFTWVQLTEARAHAILSQRLGSEDAAARNSALLRGGSTPQLADFSDVKTGASITFNLLPAGGTTGDPVVGGDYVFLVTAQDMDGVTVEKIFTVPVTDGKRAPLVPAIAAFLATETDEGLVLVASGAKLINGDTNTLTVDASGFTDRVSGKTLGQLIAAAGSKSFIQWSFVNGTIDLSDACVTANAFNSGRGNPKLTKVLTAVEAASSPSFRLSITFDNGAQVSNSNIDSTLTGSTSSSVPPGTTAADTGGLCAMRRDGQHSAGMHFLDLMVLLLPMGLLLRRRNPLCRQEVQK